MTRTFHPATRFAAALLALGASSSACGGTAISLQPAEYAPRLVDDSGSYKGTHVYLVTPTNEAQNTSTFYFYSADEKVKYGGPALTSYLWYSLEKALGAVGITVHANPPEFPAPEMNIVFTSWTETEFVGEVTLKAPRPYRRALQITFPNPPAPNATLGQRKAFAYGQIDVIAATILDDTAFRDALVAAQPPAGTVPAAAPAAQ